MAMIALVIFGWVIGICICMAESARELERLSGMAKKARQQ